MDWKGGRREYGQDAVEHSSVKREIFRTPVGACLFVRNRMRKGSGKEKESVASFLNNTSITPRA